MAFYAWMILFVVQAAWIAQGRIGRHPEFGIFGVSLATLLFASGRVVSIAGGVRLEQAGMGREVRAFLIVSWSAMIVFGTLVWPAIAGCSATGSSSPAYARSDDLDAGRPSRAGSW